uniref:Uncharacterized protein n=1 Tax=Romanomermis culicivorax TaxID=13658 RepID=A0A915JY26_ROMCU
MEESTSNSKVTTIDKVDVFSQFKQNNVTGATASQLCEKFDSILCRKRYHRLKSLIQHDPLAGQLIDDLLTILEEGQLPSRDEISSKHNQTSERSLTSGQKEMPPHRPTKVVQSGIGVVANDEELLKLVSLKHVTNDAAALDHEDRKNLGAASRTASLFTATSNLSKMDGGRPIKYWRQILRTENVDKQENKDNGQKHIPTTISFEMKKFYDKVIGTQDIYPRVDGEFQ